MVWFWLNVPLAVAFFGAWCGIPFAKVLRNPDWGPQRADGYRVHPAGPAPAGAGADGGRRVGAPALAGTGR